MNERIDELTSQPNSTDTQVGSVATEPLDFQRRCLELLSQAVNNQTEFSRNLSEVSGQNAFMRQQQGQLYAAVNQLYQAVTLQCQQLLQSDATLQRELQKFQTGGPQRAMAGLFNKLFRELITHVNDLDDITAGLEEVQKQNPIEAEWLKALNTARARLERTLESWGCLQMNINIGDEFDPERHRAVEAHDGDITDAVPEHSIVKVKRRGWVLNDEILQHPDVIVR